MRTASSKVRTDNPRVAEEGMMLFFVPAWSCPTVMTTDSVAAIPRETTCWSR